MNYEKAYKEALERAKNLRKDAIDMGENIRAKQCEIIFPELKEDEDEKIRKALIQYIKNWKANIQGKAYPYLWSSDEEECNKLLAWLEKQGGTSKEWTISDAATLKELIDFLENGTAKLQHDLTRYANWLKIQFTPIEKKSEQKSTDKAEPIPERR